MHGWRVTYLGADLPAAEIANAAKASLARAVALSVVHPPDDPRVREELAELRELLPPSVGVVIGGRAARSYQDTASQLGIPVLNGLVSFRAFLEGLMVSSQ